MAVSTQTQRLKLVLLPGMDGTGELLSEFAAALAGEFEVATERYPTERSLSYSELESFVRAVCPTSGPFVLLAESYSTPLAIKCAASKPENLEGLVLCAGFATSPMRGWRRFFGWLLAPLMFRIPLPNLAAKLWLVGPDAPPSLLELAGLPSLPSSRKCWLHGYGVCSPVRSARRWTRLPCPSCTSRRSKTVSSVLRVSTNSGTSSHRSPWLRLKGRISCFSESRTKPQQPLRGSFEVAINGISDSNPDKQAMIEAAEAEGAAQDTETVLTIVEVLSDLDDIPGS